jgi:uncharacterized membrane protein
MGTKRGFDRMIFFTDAVTAIAITLLILPLVDLVPEAKPDTSAAVFLGDHLSQLFSFALSFVVIARLWVANHRIFEHVELATRALMWLNLAWAFTVVFLPLPTALTAGLHPSRSTIALYIGTMALSSIILSLISIVIYRRPDIENNDRLKIVSVEGNVSTSVLFVVAFGVAVIWPHLTYYPLLLLLLSGPIDRFVRPRLERWEARRDSFERPTTG